MLVKVRVNKSSVYMELPVFWKRLSEKQIFWKNGWVLNTNKK